MSNSVGAPNEDPTLDLTGLASSERPALADAITSDVTAKLEAAGIGIDRVSPVRIVIAVRSSRFGASDPFCRLDVSVRFEDRAALLRDPKRLAWVTSYTDSISNVRVKPIDLAAKIRSLATIEAGKAGVLFRSRSELRPIPTAG
jgi:hypothetical protein